MNNSDWKTIKTIVSEILEVSEIEQQKALESALRKHPAFAEAINSHYLSIKDSDGFWKETIKANSDLIQTSMDMDALEAIPVVEYKSGSRIGAYVIQDQIGKGGMGIVFKAQRADGQFERVVAIKLMALHIHFDEVQKRFEQEQKILASLNHPNIAQLYDAGVTAAGNPYLVMEFVEGENLLSYCVSKKLPKKERIRLFLEVCKAVEFAHSKLVVHRDLKPENIMVNKAGDIKVLDFGIAKLVDESMDSIDEAITKEQQRLYSLSYASPEQIKSEFINTSSDVYTLGVLLFEILTGKKLFELNDFSRRAAEELILSQTINHDKWSALDGDKDVEAIILKAIRTEPNQRYGSIFELKNDIDAYLQYKPVQARVGNVGYTLSKFWKRNKKIVSVGALLFIIANSFFAFYTIRINTERDIAQTESEKSKLVTDYLIELFENADPFSDGGRDQTLEDFIQQSINDLSALNEQPELKLQAAFTLARVTANLGDYQVSESLFLNSLQLADSLNSAPEVTVPILYYFGLLKQTAGQYRASIGLLQDAFSLMKAFKTQDAKQNFNLRLSLASSLAHIGEIEQAEELVTSLIEQNTSNTETISLEFIQSLSLLADVSREKEEFEASANFELQVISFLEAYFPDRKELLMTAYNNTGFSYRNLGNFEQALEYYSKALVLVEEVVGFSHPNALVLLNNISVVHKNLEQYDQFLLIRNEHLKRTKSEFGEQHWRTASSYGSLSEAQANVQDSNAINTMNTSIQIFEEVLSENHFWTLRQRLRLGQTYFLFDEEDRGNQLISETLTTLKATTTSPLAYYDRNSLTYILETFRNNSFEYGAIEMEEFLVWYEQAFGEGS